MDTKKPTGLQALAIFACGGLMVFFGCYGALGAVVSYPGGSATPGVLVMLVGFVVFIWGLVLLGRYVRQERGGKS